MNLECCKSTGNDAISVSFPISPYVSSIPISVVYFLLFINKYKKVRKQELNVGNYTNSHSNIDKKDHIDLSLKNDD
ncbi:hypothetical protein RclHR1_02200013 [Rhizophagus clarus]|uniref:Uncharacterized protein n=1 Tax=Rhizophagus clarus TaxID=94130 RepID=A0A2Z6QYG8_9GLOM|nr:hypothetical protein RclHR1_02200013 [Rhizophagus clarus]GES79600.1 hypothetical protein RCL_e8815_RclHR1_02200013 [Rhizophagus clarus]